MIYLDTSIVLAKVLAEDRTPPAALWLEPLASSRLLEYEAWVRLHGRGFSGSHGALLAEILDGVDFVPLDPLVLRRALDPFARPVKTLDALHLSTALWLADRAADLEVASYDTRLRAAAETEGLRLYPL